jgi:hypothetical protein
MALTSGTKLGPYEILAPIGAGGMGEVYRARDTRLGREVAIKVLPEALAKDAERLQRFEQEARTIAALNHPNILGIHDIGNHDGTPFLVSELLEGQTLREKLEAGPLPLRRAIEYALGIAQRLAAAHDKGIVHRDLKPENVFITREGRVKVLDFGLAKLLRPEQSRDTVATLASPATLPGMVMGTVGYMSPEQVKGGASDARSDIFSFGAVLYEMLSGKRAFKCDTSAETMTAILREEPADLTETGWQGPPALQRILTRCLEKNVERRFQSASDLAFAIESLSGSSSATSASPISQAVGPPKTPRPWLTWAAAGLGVLALVAAVWAAGRRSAAKPVWCEPVWKAERAVLTTPQGARLLDIVADGRILFSIERQQPEIAGIDPATGKERRALEWFGGGRHLAGRESDCIHGVGRAVRGTLPPGLPEAGRLSSRGAGPGRATQVLAGWNTGCKAPADEATASCLEPGRNRREPPFAGRRNHKLEVCGLVSRWQASVADGGRSG